MQRQRALLPLLSLLMTGLVLLPLPAYAADAPRPAVIQALEEQGLANVQEFDIDGDVRGFAGLGGERPVTVYVLPTGEAIVGTRLNVMGEPLDEAILQDLLAQPISERAWAELEAASWVRDGQADAPRIVYTFTDPNCPYCNLFWEASRPWVEAGKVQLRHLLVGVIRPDSPGKAAAILEAPDQSAALQENEENYDHGGIAPVESIADDSAAILDANQSLMSAMGFRGTPGIVVRDDEGVLRSYSGMPPSEALDDVFGPR